MEKAICVNHLTKDYKEGKGIFDFNFSINKGEVFGLVGTNGSGKTTLIRHMMGFLHGQEGSVTIMGMDAWKEAAKIKNMVGYVPGQIDFPDVGTGTSFLKIQKELLGLRDVTYMNELIERFQIDITAPLKRMSKGMKQKMALVAAFMNRPEILLLDEPSTGLDPLMRDTLIELILEQKQRGATIFMSSHIFKELDDTCDGVVFIRNGHMLDTITQNELNENPIITYEIEFHDQQGLEQFLTKENTRGIRTETNPDRKRMALYVLEQETRNFVQILSRHHLKSLHSNVYSLENYYNDLLEDREVAYV